MIESDTKNWTWVLERPCPECGFDASAISGTDVAPLVRANLDWWSDLAGSGEIGPTRTRPDRWSSLEYACHVRDVYRRFDERLELMATVDDPLFANWDQDAAAIEDRYSEQEPVAVVAALAAAGGRLSRRLDETTGDGWLRPGRRNDGSRFTVDTLSRYMAHDVVHHIWDVSTLR